MNSKHVWTKRKKKTSKEMIERPMWIDQAFKGFKFLVVNKVQSQSNKLKTMSDNHQNSFKIVIYYFIFVVPL